MSFLDDPRFDVGVGLVTAEALGLAALLVTAITLGVRGDRRIARGNRGGLGLPRDEHLDRARFHYALTAREGDKALREGTCVRSVRPGEMSPGSSCARSTGTASRPATPWPRSTSTCATCATIGPDLKESTMPALVGGGLSARSLGQTSPTPADIMPTWEKVWLWGILGTFALSVAGGLAWRFWAVDRVGKYRPFRGALGAPRAKFAPREWYVYRTEEGKLYAVPYRRARSEEIYQRERVRNGPPRDRMVVTSYSAASAKDYASRLLR